MFIIPPTSWHILRLKHGVEILKRILMRWRCPQILPRKRWSAPVVHKVREDLGDSASDFLLDVPIHWCCQITIYINPDVYQAWYCYDIIWEVFRSNSSLSSVCGLGTRISPLVTHYICKWMSSFYPPVTPVYYSVYTYIYIYLRAVSTIKIHQDTVHPSFALFPSKHFGIPETQI